MKINKKELTLSPVVDLTTPQPNHRYPTLLVRRAFNGFFAYCLAALLVRADNLACPFAKVAEGAVPAVRSSGWDPPTSGSYVHSPRQTFSDPLRDPLCEPSRRSFLGPLRYLIMASLGPRQITWQISPTVSTQGLSVTPLRSFSLVHVLLVLLTMQALSSCSPLPTPYPTPAPEGFVAMNIPADNPLTEEGVTLGRALFFDPILSQDSTVSCGTCHRPALAFTDGGSVSQGIRQRRGRRSAPSLLNIGFHYKGVFWDGRSPSLESQALHPLTDSLEMGNDWPLVQKRLRAHPYYATAFQRAFPGRPLDRENIAKALAQFQRTLVSADSKFDRVMRGKQQFTERELRGWTIFFDAGYPETPMAECSHCHSDPLFTNLDFANNGLDRSTTLTDFPDPGLGHITGIKYDNGKFRVPTLRNILQTAPYMHDGRMVTIEEVLLHYNNGGAYAENVDPNVRPLGLSEQDRLDLLAFLQTLTDSIALNNPAYYPAEK